MQLGIIKGFAKDISHSKKMKLHPLIWFMTITGDLFYSH